MSSLRDVIIGGAPDPDDADRRLERLSIAAERSDLDLERLSAEAKSIAALACRRAPYLATLLTRDPRRLVRTSTDPYLHRQKPAAIMATQLAARLAEIPHLDDDAFRAILRIFRADELVRLGARELEFGTPLQVGEELAHLAETCFDAAIRHYRVELERRYGVPTHTDDDGQEKTTQLAVIGMGKLGGEELNFSSDVDVIYVYSSDQGELKDISLHQFFATLCTQVTAALHDSTEEDCVFRVDLRLRPEGNRGVIANSLLSLERYYEAFGHPWERQAWLKARASAGCRLLGNEVLSTLAPFIYPRTTSATIVDQVTELNRKIKSEFDDNGIESGFDVKNGVGGIREVEFFTQALQLVHAGRQPKLRCQSTMAALDALLFLGLIDDQERGTLARGYRFLRHLEHLLQLETGRQTQRLPANAAGLDLFARRAGFANANALQQKLDHHTRAIASLFATLSSDQAAPPTDIFQVLNTHENGRQQELLEKLGFRQPAEAAQELSRAMSKVDSPFDPDASGPAAKVAPLLLQEISRSPDPDQALRFVSELGRRCGAWSPLWRLLLESRPTLRLLASLFGTSAYLSKTFVRHPEQFEALVSAVTDSPARDSDALRGELERRLAKGDPDNQEDQWNTLASFKNDEVLRIGLADIAGLLAPDEVCFELTTVAEVCLDFAWSTVVEVVQQRHGRPLDAAGAPVGLAVLALGKFGGRELGYASDLDLIFVYHAEGNTSGDNPIANVTFASRVAQRLMTGLHSLHPGGRLYEIDTRLRPSGSQGLLVSSLPAWRKYHRESAAAWERQALIKLRPVVGDLNLGQQVLAEAREFAFSKELQRGPTAAGILAMRDRIGDELGERTSGDVKMGRGGLIDIEFAVQYLQLVYGAAHPNLQVQSTLAAIAAAKTEELIENEMANLFADGYLFLRHLEHRLRIVNDRSEHRLPSDVAELDKLARRAGYPDGPALTNAFERWARSLRETSDQVLRATASM